MNWIDRALGVHPSSLALRSRRGEVLAANIANADTPGYKAKDISFQDVLKTQSGTKVIGLKATHAGHAKLSSDGIASSLLYRVPTKDMENGNSVEPEVEQAAFSENAVMYQTSLQFLDGAISSLRLAIKGQ